MIRYASHFALLFFSYLFTYYVFTAIQHPIPTLGDSWDYHIPIASSLLTGDFLTASHATIPQQYYPGASELFLAFFMLLHIPLTLSNALAILVLGFVCWKLARTFRLSFYYSLFFALTILTLTAITRWMNAISIDVWVAVFFCSALLLLEKPQKTLRYFFLLGMTLGMLIGSKYMGVLYVILLLALYGKKLFPTLSIQRLLILLLPFSILGLFWYVRNALIVGNPFYPLCLFSLPCHEVFHTTILTITGKYPLQMFHAFFGEYKFWMLAPFVVGIVVVVRKRLLPHVPYGFFVLSLLGEINFLLSFFFPTSAEPWIMVSSLRYSYPAFIPLILALFLIAKQTKKESLLCYVALAQMLPTLTMDYHPKLILVSLPLAGICIFFLNKRGAAKRK